MLGEGEQKFHRDFKKGSTFVIAQRLPEKRHGVSHDNRNRASVPAFHHTNRKRGTSSSKTDWFLQYSVGVSSQSNATSNNLESQDEVSLKREGLEQAESLSRMTRESLHVLASGSPVVG